MGGETESMLNARSVTATVNTGPGLKPAFAFGARPATSCSTHLATLIVSVRGA